jgi:hypothetical protein
MFGYSELKTSTRALRPASSPPPVHHEKTSTVPVAVSEVPDPPDPEEPEEVSSAGVLAQPTRPKVRTVESANVRVRLRVICIFPLSIEQYPGLGYCEYAYNNNKLFDKHLFSCYQFVVNDNIPMEFGVQIV